MLNMDYVLESYSFLQLIDELLEDFSRYYLRQRKIFHPDLTPYYSLSLEQLLLYISILFSNNYDTFDSYLPKELKQDVVGLSLIHILLQRRMILLLNRQDRHYNILMYERGCLNF